MSTQITGTSGVSQIQDGTVTTAKIVDGTISTADIGDAQITPAKLNGAQSGSAPIYGIRAWCSFSGTATGTNPPAAGGNVASVTRNSTGNYTVTFTTAMPDTDYAISIVSGPTAAFALISSVSTSSFTFTTQTGAAVTTDTTAARIMVCR